MPSSDAPIYDYNMIDDDFMLAPVAAAYLFEHQGGRGRAKELSSARRTANGERVGAALARNFSWVAQSARAFAQAPEPANLISLKPGLNFGEWRDSQDGLAGGRYPYDVNAVFVPAAMACDREVRAERDAGPYLTLEQRTALSHRRPTIAAVWSREAPELFRVQLADADARRQVSAYAAELGVSAAPALAALPGGYSS